MMISGVGDVGGVGSVGSVGLVVLVWCWFGVGGVDVSFTNSFGPRLKVRV